MERIFNMKIGVIRDYVNRNTLEKMNSEDVQIIKNIKDRSFYRTERKREK